MALASATGLSLTTGTNGSAAFTASSPAASVNSALNAVTYPVDAPSSSTNASLTVNALAAPAITCIGHGARDREHLARLRERQQQAQFP